MSEKKNSPPRDARPRLSDVIRAAAHAKLSGHEDCASPERLHAAVAGDLPAAEARTVLAHAEMCGACSAELALAQQFERAASAGELAEAEALLAEVRRPIPAAEPLRRVVPGRRWVARTLAAAAILLLGVTVAPRLFPTRPPIGPISNVQRGNEIVLQSPLGVVKPGPLGFSWSDVPGAAAYTLTVRAADETTLVMERTSSENRLDLASGGNEAPFHPGSVYTWSVRAMGANGDVVGESGTATFQVKAESATPR